MSDKTKVVITDEQKTVKVPKGIRMIVRRSCLAALQMENIGSPCVINVTFTDNAKMRELKKRYTGEGSEAGAMWLPETDDGVFGTIVISLEKAQELARFYDCSFQKEICYLTVHETLRLIEHKKQSGFGKLEMQEKMETIMYQMGLPLSSGYELNNNLQELPR
jgi:probable rRNA maturation factor